MDACHFLTFRSAWSLRREYTLLCVSDINLGELYPIKMKVNIIKTNPPLGGILAVEFYKSLSNNIEIIWGTESFVQIPNFSKPIVCSTSNDIIRILERTYNLEPDPLQKVTLNHWLSFSLTLQSDLPKSLEYLDRTLGPITYLIGESVSVADLAVFSILHVIPGITEVLNSKQYNNIDRWMRLLQAQPFVSKTLNSLPSDVTANLFNKQSIKKAQSPENTVGRQQEGKFVELPYAEMGKVVVRFPPEASGYLHIGHAKAALLNQYYQEAFQGKLIMRFDDTNPAKENAEFEKVILEDVEMLEIKPDRFTHTSEYFDLMLEYCEKLIKDGKAFVDDTSAEQMKSEREQKIDSKNKSNSIEQNLQLWEEMKLGSQIGTKCCVRAKIDMQSTNGCLRDPTIYRCKPEEHPRTGTKYKVYPTYDFACPIVDSIEGVTHVLRTMEYHDRDPQFYWFIDALGLRKPYIWEYSRLSMTNTVLSKRKLTWFVEEGLVDGWDDPRMPTVRGVLRRGMTVEGLRQFIQAQGSSRSVVFMEWDKIWAINKKVIDPIAPRYTALETSPVPVTLKNVIADSTLTVALHPKNPDIGNKTIWVSKELFIDQVDAKALKEGENATFINYGNVMIDKIHRLPDGTVSSIDATPNLENKDFKKTLKLTWLADTPNSSMVETYCVYFDHLLSKSVLGKDEDFKQYIGHQTRWEIPMLGEPELSKLRQGDIIQLQRRGFFRVDVTSAPPSPLTGKARPLILFHIPDGHTKDMPGQPKPTAATSQSKRAPAPNSSVEKIDQLNISIIEQGNLVRSLKASKAEKAKTDEAVKTLLELKAQYKNATGQDWKPGATPVVSTTSKSEPVNSKVVDLLSKISQQGDTVRQLKTQKADKAIIEAEVKTLLTLKADYKKETGKDWTPNEQAIQNVTRAQSAASKLEGDDRKIANLLAKITKQGDLVRQLKGQKAPKATIDAEVKTLLELKTDYKKETGTDWTPNVQQSLPQAQPVKSTIEGDNTKVADLLATIAKQGDQVRQLKAQKADKTTIDAEIKTLLALKAEFKKETGKDWTPNAQVQAQASPQPVMNGNDKGHALAAEVAKQGDVVRDLKTKKADKATVDAEVKKLLELKVKYQAETGKAYTPPSQSAGDFKPKEKKEEKKEHKSKEAKPKEKKTKEQSPKLPANQKDESTTGVKKITRLGLEASKETDLPEWYSQVITKAEMIEYYDISGCYILRPWSFGIWDLIREFLISHFKKLGVKECYFPIFVSKAALEREKTHIADFAAEVAWVTHSGSSELAEHIAVRPTSETVMYPAYAKWIQSHRDLPLKLNQWNNVVRWEFKQPQPFIRTREFLWQEGHTAFLSKQEADEEVLTILDLYARVYEELLAIPVIRGRKTEKEKFAGGDYTTTVEAYVPANGRAVQGATSHHLGQNFAKMFEIIYDDPETQEKKYVYQNSWGLTTRTIGVMILVHGDDRGLVLPPRVATVQAIVVPCGITASSTQEERKNLIDSCKELVKDLCNAGIRAEGDYRDNYSPGWKFNHWELKGVPVRVELGPKDLAKSEIVAVTRFTGEKTTYKRATAPSDILALLKKIHDEMFTRATIERNSRLSMVSSWDEFTSALERKHILLVPFCGETPCEDNIKNDSARLEEDNATEVKAPAMGAKSLCIPFEQPRALTAEDKCIHPKCTNEPKFFTLFGRSY